MSWAYQKETTHAAFHRCKVKPLWEAKFEDVRKNLHRKELNIHF